VSLVTPETVWQLQKALHAKAKREPACRFHSLYDKLYRKDVLRHAWQCCRANGGAPGVDGVTFQQIEQEGVNGWLEKLVKELHGKTYRPQAVRRVWIPKPGTDKQRPLGVPCIKDRVIQMAAVLILEPIFEADLPEEQYGYRRGRGAHDAIRTIHRLLDQGHREVVDCDLSGYFDSIPHAELMRSVARRISDGAMLALINAWLQIAVEEDDGHGGKCRTTVAKDSGRGTPQGAPISPLLSNLYMRRFVLGWKKLGWEEKLQARLVVYADDFVILCRSNAEKARRQMQVIMRTLKLTVNEQKTRVCRVPQESFDFLGFTLGQCYSPRNGRAYIGMTPSRKRVSAICQEISRMTQREFQWKSVEDMVDDLNRTLRGWGNYFRLGTVSRAYRAVDNHARHRLRQWLNGKHQSRGIHSVRQAPLYLHEKLGLIRLGSITSNFSWAKA
jgi:RNA-directed DNA polymerase